MSEKRFNQDEIVNVIYTTEKGDNPATFDIFLTGNRTLRLIGDEAIKTFQEIGEELYREFRLCQDTSLEPSLQNPDNKHQAKRIDS